MANPTRQTVHVNRPLTNISIAYMQSAANFIASRVFPIVPVMKQSDKYFVYDQNDFMRDEAEVRAPGTESGGGGFRLSDDTYYTGVYAHHMDVADQLVSNTDQPLDLERDAAEYVAQILMIRRERQFVNTYFTTGVWGTDRAGVAASPTGTQFLRWDDASSDPVGDVKAGVRTIQSNTGFKPNTLVLGPEVFDALTEHVDIRDRIKYVTSESINAAMLANVFGVERVLVGETIYGTNNEGATAAYSFNYGKSALLCYSNPRPSLRMPSAGYLFGWNDYGGANMVTKRFYMEHLESTRIEGQMAFDMKVVGQALGLFFSAAVS